MTLNFRGVPHISFHAETRMAKRIVEGVERGRKFYFQSSPFNVNFADDFFTKMDRNKNKWIRYAASLFMTVGMVATAELFSEQEIIFPEVVALAVGLWVVEKRVWKVRSWQVVGLLTMGATTGLCLVLYSPFPNPVNLCIAFAFAGSCLIISRTTLIPLISACMLPVLLHTESWIYPISVGVMSILMVAGQKIMEKSGIRPHIEHEETTKPKRKVVTQWLWLLCYVTLIIVLTIITNCPFLVIPPLVVTFVEIANSKAGFRYRPVQVFLILTTAVIIGSVAQFLGHYVAHLPQFVVALFIVISLFTLFERVGKYFAPAGALAFIPMLVSRDALLWLPLQAALGAALFITIAMIAFMKCYKWPRAQLVYCLTTPFIREYIARSRKSPS